MILNYYYSHEAIFRFRQKRGSLDENIVSYFLIFEINHSKKTHKKVETNSKCDITLKTDKSEIRLGITLVQVNEIEI